MVTHHLDIRKKKAQAIQRNRFMSLPFTSNLTLSFRRLQFLASEIPSNAGCKAVLSKCRSCVLYVSSRSHNLQWPYQSFGHLYRFSKKLQRAWIKSAELVWNIHCHLSWVLLHEGLISRIGARWFHLSFGKFGPSTKPAAFVKRDDLW